MVVLLGAVVVVGVVVVSGCLDVVETVCLEGVGVLGGVAEPVDEDTVVRLEIEVGLPEEPPVGRGDDEGPGDVGKVLVTGLEVVVGRLELPGDVGD